MRNPSFSANIYQFEFAFFFKFLILIFKDIKINLLWTKGLGLAHLCWWSPNWLSHTVSGRDRVRFGCSVFVFQRVDDFFEKLLVDEKARTRNTIFLYVVVLNYEGHKRTKLPWIKLYVSHCLWGLVSPQAINQAEDPQRSVRFSQIRFVFFIKILSLIYWSIGSQTEIGLKDTKDKGLGFEALNVNNTDHEYSQLNEENRALLLNIRETIIEFVLKVTEKLIEEKSNDTTLLVLVSRVFSSLISIFSDVNIK